MKSLAIMVAGVFVVGLSNSALAQDSPMQPEEQEPVIEQPMEEEPIIEPEPYEPAPMDEGAVDEGEDIFAPQIDIEQTTEADTEPTLLTPMGMSIQVGGGVTGFTANNVLDVSNDVGGAWNAELVIGTRLPVALEAQYQGQAIGMDALGLDDDAVVIGTGLSAVARLNFTVDRPLQPYILAGGGWKHYELTNADFNTSSVRDDDDVFEIPVGAGLSYRVSRVIFDLRGMFRPAFDSDLVRGGQDDAPLHNWQGRLGVGFEF